MNPRAQIMLLCAAGVLTALLVPTWAAASPSVASPRVVASQGVVTPQGASAPQAAAARVRVEPESLRLEVGQKATVTATVTDAAGNVVDAEVLFFSESRRNIRVDSRSGEVEALVAGDYEVIAVVPVEGSRISLRNLEGQIAAVVTVRVVRAPARSVAFHGLPARFYAGTEMDLRVDVVAGDGTSQPDAAATFTSRSPEVASVDETGTLRLLAPGRVLIDATVDGTTQTLDAEVIADPVVRFEIVTPARSARTGDVVRFEVSARDVAGQTVPDLPIRYAVAGTPAATIRGVGATALVTSDGRFVAERSGTYRVFAIVGNHVAAAEIEVTARNVGREVELVGRGPVRDRHTSDLWVWEGVDGRDYAVTGTWGADGDAYFWDVTEPSRIRRVGELRVDARTVNDVKVSADGRIAVISREGASNRRNGLVIVDVSNPAAPAVLSSFDDNLTGGVHNVFIYEQHIYALSAGRRYDVINIEDPRNPRRVSSFELDTRGHSIHDVWVADGIAYSSNWSDGIVAVDVGGGGRGGSPDNPVMLGKATYPSGANHAAIPFRSRSTGKLYVIGGDEIFPLGMNTAAGGRPTYPLGWIHFFEWDDWKEPVEVARFQVPEAGTHNVWVDEDNEVLYVAYYNGGLRVVDISGELLGDLYRQGREIAAYVPDDPDGFIANAPMVWGPQPYKGLVFFSDWNSGLWAVRVTDRPRRVVGEGRD